MELISGKTYWDKTLEEVKQFDSITDDIDIEVLIVGGGMSGNLAAYLLAESGHKVIVIEKNRIGQGSSSANTGLLQYSSDIMLCELAEEIGQEKAILFYTMCLNAMKNLSKLNNNLSKETDYIGRDSIYYASNKDDEKKLKKEYSILEKNNFPVEFIDNESLKSTYGIDKACALKTWKDAEVNPYKFIRALVNENIKLGVKYYENTCVDLNNIGKNKAYTKDKKTLNYQSIILATGYTKVYDLIKDKARIDRTYAFSATTSKIPPWKDSVMIWETKMPYIYFRSAQDNRIIAGGLDESIAIVQKDENIIYNKTEQIKKEIESFFPDLDLKIDYRWNALFGSSKDGLPFIGRDPSDKNIYYLLGYEGNGTCYSMAGAEILLDLIEGRENPYGDILRVDR